MSAGAETKAGGGAAAIDAIVEAALVVAIAVLQRRPDLAQRLQAMLAPTPQARTDAPTHMSVAEYADYRCVSVRTLYYDLEEMSEGVQFERVGRARRRYVIKVQEADRWHSERSLHDRKSSPGGQTVVDAVTQFRARAALKKLRKKR